MNAKIERENIVNEEKGRNNIIGSETYEWFPQFKQRWMINKELILVVGAVAIIERSPSEVNLVCVAHWASLY